MKNRFWAIPIVVGALAFAGCSHSSDSGSRGGAATGAVNSPSSGSSTDSDQLPSGRNAPSSRTPSSGGSSGGYGSGGGM